MIAHWHDGLLPARVPPGEGSILWSVATATDPGLVPTADDLTDAAAARDGSVRLARRLLARALVARVTGCAPASVVITRDAHGAPRVASPEGWHVSLSGNGDRTLIGLARLPIGVDREPLGAGETLWDMLAPGETAMLRGIGEGERADAWLRRWTTKEAHAKLIGEPRRIRPEAIETWLDPDGRGGASFEGRSDIVSRIRGGAVETAAMWRIPSISVNAAS